jgi:hypothetical protein
MVYHGPTKTAQSYFEALDYFLPLGESVADWLIDIRSGRLEPLIPARLELLNRVAEGSSHSEIVFLLSPFLQAPLKSTCFGFSLAALS